MRDFVILPGDFMELLDSDLERRVLFRMLRHADRRGRCFMGHEHLADAIKTSRGSVTTTIGKLAAKGHVEKVPRGRGFIYQISERFLVSAQARRPARSDGRVQPGLLLPIDGAQAASAPRKTGAQRAPPAPVDKTPTGLESEPPAPPTGLKSEPTCPDSSPRKRAKERLNPSSTSESEAARARIDAGAVEKILSTTIPRRAARAGPDFADPAVRRAKWMSDCIEWIVRSWAPAAAQAAVTVIIEDSEGPAAKRLLERASAERQARRRQEAKAARGAGRGCGSAPPQRRTAVKHRWRPRARSRAARR